MNNLLLKLKIPAALIVLIILNGSVYSQTLISSANVNNNATLVSKQLTKNTKASTSLEIEPENWMSNKNYLDFSSSNLNLNLMFIMNEEVSESNEIEDWMLDESEWILSNSVAENFNDELESIEDWMLDKDFWKINSEIEDNSIEDWMLNDKFWLMLN